MEETAAVPPESEFGRLGVSRGRPEHPHRVPRGLGDSGAKSEPEETRTGPPEGFLELVRFALRIEQGANVPRAEPGGRTVEFDKSGIGHGERLQRERERMRVALRRRVEERGQERRRHLDRDRIEIKAVRPSEQRDPRVDRGVMHAPPVADRNVVGSVVATPPFRPPPPERGQRLRRQIDRQRKRRLAHRPPLFLLPRQPQLPQIGQQRPPGRSGRLARPFPQRRLPQRNPRPRAGAFRRSFRFVFHIAVSKPRFPARP